MVSKPNLHYGFDRLKLHMTTLKQLFGDRFWGRSGIVLILHGCGLLMGYLVHFCLVRWMGSNEYGMLSYANSVAALIGIVVAFGLPFAGVRFVPELRAKERFSELQGFLQFGGWTIFLFSLLSGGGLALANMHFGFFRGADREVMLLGLGFALPTSALAGWQYEILRGEQRVLAISWLHHLISPTVLLGGCWYVFRFHKSLLAIEVLMAMALVSFSGWFIFAINQAYAWRNQNHTVKSSYHIRHWINVSFSMFLSGLFVVIMAQIDVFLIGSMIDARSAGIYGLSAKVSGLICIFFTAANVLAAPLYVQLYGDEKHDDMQRFSCLMAHIVFWPSLGLSVIMLIFGGVILSWVGDEFREGYLVMVILVVGQLVNVGSGPVGQFADLTGLHGPAAIIRGCCAILNVVLSWIMIKVWDLSGAAFSTSVCLVLWNVLLHRLVSRERGLRLSIWSTLSLFRRTTAI